jgi:hypothetical protein
LARWFHDGQTKRPPLVWRQSTQYLEVCLQLGLIRAQSRAYLLYRLGGLERLLRQLGTWSATLGLHRRVQ